MKTYGIIIFLVLLVSMGYSANYYVAKTGNDSNPGTEAQPWLTIQKAANTAAAGDTVYIKSGTYNERVQPQNSGTAGNYITYRQYQDDTVTIDGTGITLPDDWGGLLDLSGRSYIMVSGLRVINAGPSDNHCGVLIDNGSYITVESCYTYNTVSSGIAAWNSSNITLDGNEVELACNDGEQECITVAVTSDFEIKNCHVHDSGPGSIGGEGIDAKDGASNGKIYNNRVHDLNRLGIYVDAWDKHTYNIQIYNNIVYNINGNDGFTLASESGGLLENISIYNNIAYNCDESGITIGRNGDAANHPMSGISVINNTFYNCGSATWGGGISIDNPDIQSLTVRNNILSQNVFFQMNQEADVPVQNLTIEYNLIHGFRNYDDEIKGNNPVEGDPLFVNPSGADFQLQTGSPAIDAGSSTGAPSTDYAGTARPQGSGYDIGAYEYAGGATNPAISLSPTSISLASTYGSTTTTGSSFTVSNSGGGTLNWSISDDAAWLSVSPTSGSVSSSVTVTADPTGLGIGNYTGTITVSSTNATNSPQTVTVSYTIMSSGQDQPPFGVWDLPADGSNMRSSVAFTGWALDDIEVDSVKIYLTDGSTSTWIGDADLVEGARGDVAAAFPTYPNNTKAGWGYMMLTNFLPGQGNGTYTFQVIAYDKTGNKTILGTKTVTADNANAYKPFGAIDTPTQGGTASGSGFVNFGWVLTPMPNSIPTDGSTINVIVDSQNVGNPTYNQYRPDIAAFFPGYANSNGASGFFELDTTQYTDGVYTIQWTATDSAGNTDGIGSRFFTIQNSGSRENVNNNLNNEIQSGKHSWVLLNKPVHRGPETGLSIVKGSPVDLFRGFSRQQPPVRLLPDEKGMVDITVRQLEPVQFHLARRDGPDKRFYWAGAMEIGKTNPQLMPLPIGSTLDGKGGIFYWMPAHAFYGEYRLVFAKIDRKNNRIVEKKRFRIMVTPKKN